MLRRRLQRIVIEVDPGGAELRHRQARADREVSATAAADGMADLYARITAPDWIAISTVTTPSRPNRIATQITGRNRR